jgi:hypothetical protein
LEMSKRGIYSPWSSVTNYTPEEIL